MTQTDNQAMKLYVYMHFRGVNCSYEGSVSIGNLIQTKTNFNIEIPVGLSSGFECKHVNTSLRCIFLLIVICYTFPFA